MPTFTKELGLLRDNPVTRVYVLELKVGKEAANSRDHVVRDVVASRAADEEGWLLKGSGERCVEGKVSHVSKGAGQDLQRDPKPQSLCASRSIEVRQEELPYGQRLRLETCQVSGVIISNRKMQK